ncbi:hypothetical protein KI688_011278 [Linnemannia hyalina]|uniref:HAT C-terminal dimerisation domain-containing protein n=1 Tax=Linnemannia hyalina TaxID=64524 RepID=A0A9P8BU22_9FUNG|nr:hypothetical protein KI688_011278 [Linnemannia hyalina]
MYTQALKLLPDFSAMKTDIGKKDLDKGNKEQGLEDLDMSEPAGAAIEHEVVVLRIRNELRASYIFFWRKYKGRHEMIANVARRFLYIWSTSCEAERVFNKARYVTSNRRANLSISNLRYILFSNNITKV